MKRFILLTLVLLLAVSLCGCFLEPAESLYAIPKQSADYNHLHSAIEAAMPEGAAYAPPTAGDHQQAVQFADLDGDKEDEAIVYLKTTGDRPLMVCVFDKRGDTFAQIAAIEGAGSSFDRVQYVPMDDHDGYELVIGRQVSDQVMQTLDVYALHGDTLVELLTANYTEFLTTNLTGGDTQELFVIRSGGEQCGIAELYRWGEGQMNRLREARLTGQDTAVKRIITGKMCKDVPAVFVASEYGEGMIVTDIFGIRNGEFANLTLIDETDTGVETLRDYYVYSSDIDGDGLIELPHVYPLGSLDGDETSQNRSVIQWYNRQLDGSEQNKTLTYHDYSGGWYLELPESWKERLIVSHAAVTQTASALRFLLSDGDGASELFRIAAVSSENTRRSLEADGWKVLETKGDTAYLCLVSGGFDLNRVTEMFHLIRVDWNTGETE